MKGNLKNALHEFFFETDENTDKHIFNPVSELFEAKITETASMQSELPEHQAAILFRIAQNVRKHAYCPYSHYQVGAALLTADGKIYTGVNVENASFSMTNCAERSAIFAAVSQGERNFVALAVCGGKEGEEIDVSCTPCGACRQVLAEFCSADFPVILASGVCALSELLPKQFRL